MARMYLASGLVEYAEPNYVVQALSTFPNDSSFSQLYGLHNTGQTGGTADADIDAPEAWDTTKGASSVVVAVIDTGVDYTHPDLSANMWTNSGEIPNNGLDDDGDGYVDDYRGWDFVNEDNDPMDDNKHGTHVSGTIGGVGNNGTGVAGVCWNVKIMPLKFLSGSGSGYTSDAVEAVLYANKKGANVMSNSWGGGGYSQALYDAIKAAEVKGILFVAAAGNSSSNNDQVANYPSNYNISNVIAVAATDANDALAWFSNYGANTVHLGAPGVSIYSTLPGNTYGSLSGTSMATPHVAGACALVWSANPSWNYAKVKNQIMVGTDKISSMSGKTVSGGRLNVYKALQAAETTPPSAVTDLSSSMVSFSTLKLKWTATGDDGNTGTATSYEIRYSTSSITSSNFSSATLISNTPTPKSAGGAEEFNVTGLSQKTTYYFAMKVTDDASNTSGLSNVTSATTDEAVVTYLDSMETGAGWTVTGLWHLSTRKSNSPTHSFYYGDETKGNYDTGSTTQGTLTSSTIDLSSGVTPQLSFQYWRKVESGGIYDKTYLEISKDNGSNWTQLWYKNSSNTSEQAWTSSGPLDLSSYKGAKVLLRFTFDSVDAYLNFYEGFYVDDVQILDSKTDFNWLSVQPATGTLTANQSSTVTLTYTAVSSGTYKGAILIKSNDPAKPSTTLSLELTATQDTTAPSAISNLKVASIASSNTSLTLTWTAPGDDDNVGTASSYEIRYSTSLITDANFSAATLAPNPPTPQVAGSTETFSLTGLALSQNYYYVAIKTQDDVGQVSSLSNVVKTSDLDSDGDGLCDQDEYSMGTDPLKSDTDSDGFSDGQEKSIGTDPVKSTDFPATIILTCDNAYEIYINGVFKGNDSNWTNKETYYAKLGDTIAIKGIDLGGIASLLCQISHGNKIMPSNFLWKASPQAASGWTNPNFDDSSWPGAVEHFAYGHGPWEQWVNGFDASNNWIWTNRPEEHDTVYFRRKVDFSQNALLRVTADNAFEAWLDGQYLGSSNVWHLPKFFIGTVSEGSLIALHGIDLGGIGGLLASLTYVDSNGKRQMVGTNSSWKISTTSSSGWQNTGFDENSWSSATEWAAFGSGVWGSFDMGAHFSNASQAKWIWASDPYSIDDIYARKTILTPNATLSMTADNKFKVYHNGNLVASSSQWWSPAVVGLNNLQNGDVIAVRADDEGGIAAFLAKLDFNGTQIFSNTTWKASTGPFWEADLSWTSKSYDDSNWTSAFPVGGNGISPWGYLSDCGSAQWIWASSDTDGVNTSFFRWTVGTNNTEVGVTSFLVSADNEYKFYKNGVLITSGSRWYMPESFTCLLSPGDVIAIEARDYGYKAGLLLYASGAYNLVSDSSWKMSTTEQSGGWASKTFDDSGWASASDHGAYGIAPWGSNASGFPTSSSARWIWGPNNQTGATNIDSHVFFRKKIA
ncbi:MAG: S8 family serine peptidase [Chlamydiae bacterium]|nr:S8 family serine peptidase [Chlamydiota bacterium]MBI3266211.1 S8 family serine peptidase [Chlamydiota bacterium]